MILTIDGVEIDTDLFEIRLNGVSHSVPPRPFEALVLLAKNRHRVVTRAEFFSTVWSTARVTDDALTQVIGEVRQLLRSVPTDGPEIRTVRGRGYRLVSGGESSTKTS